MTRPASQWHPSADGDARGLHDPEVIERAVGLHHDFHPRHERLVVERVTGRQIVEPVDFGKNARVAIEWQRSILEPKLDGALDDEERWNWLQGLTSSHKEHDVLFVADEVITAFGRTGPLFACEEDDVVPDFMTTAKGLTVTCRLDRRRYPQGREVTEEEMASINIKPSPFHGEWNYVIRPHNLQKL